MPPGIKFTIDAESRTAAAVGQSLQQVSRYEAELKKLKAASDQTTEGQARLGRMVVQVAREKEKLAKITRDAASAESALSRAAQGARDALQSQSGPLSRLVGELSTVSLAAGVGVGAFAALAIGGLAAAKGLADYQERADLAAASTGFTTREIAGLRVAFAETGRTFDQGKPALDFFARKIGEAKDTSSEAAKTFRDLGVAVKDSNGELRPTGEIYRDVQTALNGMSVETERSKQAFELFGRGASASLGALLTPLDAAIDRAQKLGIALGPEAEEVARRADAAFDSFSLTMQGVANNVGIAAARIAGPMVAALEKLTRAFALTRRGVLDFSDSFKESQDQLKDFELSQEVRRRYGEEKGKKLGVGDFVPLRDEARILGDIEKERALAAMTDEQRQKAALAAEKLGEVARAAQEAKDAFEKFKAQWVAGAAVEAGVAPFFPSGPPQVRTGLAIGGRTLPTAGDFANKLEKEGNISVETTTKKVNEDLSRLVEGLKGHFSSFISDAILGVQDLDAAFQQLAVNILSSLINLGVGALFKTLFPPAAAVGAQGGGTFLGLQKGGTVAFSDTNPILAQSGLVVSGIRGRDTVSARLGKGETVLDHTLTDNIKALVPRLDRFIADQAAGSRGGGPVNVTVYMDIKGTLDDERFWRNVTRNNIIPELRQALSTGAHR